MSAAKKFTPLMVGTGRIDPEPEYEEISDACDEIEVVLHAVQQETSPDHPRDSAFNEHEHEVISQIARIREVVAGLRYLSRCEEGDAPEAPAVTP